MNHKSLKLYAYIGIGALGVAICSITLLTASREIDPETALSVAGGAPSRGSGRATPVGTLLSGTDPDLRISKARNLASGRSPAYDADATMEVDFAKLSKDFIARAGLGSEEEKLKEFFPDGKGVNRSIRMTLLLAARGTDTEDAFSEIQLSNRVQAEIIAHGESALVSLNAGLTNLPKERIRERQTVIRLLSNIAAQQPELRSEVKTALLAEAGRAVLPSESALAITSLLKVSPTKEWFQEVNHAYERLHPGSDLSDIVAMNRVAL